MAFKEYSKNDFLYSGFASITDTYCNNTNFDDLIDSSCNIYGTDDISVTLNDIIYRVTPDNTIKKIAAKFTEISPYIFSYNGDNQLIVESAKIKFATAAIGNSASKFLGYNEDGVNHKLPYMFPNIIKTTYNPNDGPNKNKNEYNFDTSYNFGPDADIRADTTRPYYKIQTGSSMKIDTTTTDPDANPYTSAYSLIEHLNYKKIGFDSTNSQVSEAQPLTADTANKLYYKFEFVNLYGKIKVVDLLYETEADNITIDNITYNINNNNMIDPKNDNLTVSSSRIVLGKNVIKHEGKYVTLPHVVSGPKGDDKIDDTACITANQNKELCTNKSYADKLMALTTTHPGASERYENIRGFTSMSILNIFNLGIGIAATGIFIAQTYK